MFELDFNQMQQVHGGGGLSGGVIASFVSPDGGAAGGIVMGAPGAAAGLAGNGAQGTVSPDGGMSGGVLGS
jgi:hypothetical protein